MGPDSLQGDLKKITNQAATTEQNTSKANIIHLMKTSASDQQARIARKHINLTGGIMAINQCKQ
jgi:hypothetical protein